MISLTALTATSSLDALGGTDKRCHLQPRTTVKVLPARRTAAARPSARSNTIMNFAVLSLAALGGVALMFAAG